VIGPPGHYLLFALKASIGKIMRISDETKQPKN
jgi:hypothetical protein